MTHAHDQTLLARLGFSDPDRKNHLHDLACQYLARPEVAAKVFDLAQHPAPFAVVSPWTRRIVSELEVHVMKAGSGFTVGFLDAVIGLLDIAPGPDPLMCARQIVAVEVKAHPATAGDVLRQIALYRDAWPWWKWNSPHGHGLAVRDHCQQRWEPVWVLATCYPIPRREADTLTAARIKHIQLSPDRIRAWADSRAAEPYQAPEV
jgi:hypothetical protein